ncbi:ANL_collapsed_G0047050.mRNA.1.CDS.1 [Saccharomyces cerevisiae]|nr:ANL_HP_G0191490.mRNA.1.CDS.1 [Saccharomyces cerevisiae]CAI4980013.1 ANL_HP_G0038620.mRNA.1.CDS.1 [Saccharomyces cerevisiae]CAI5013947.1 ANL_HP_G0066570.mRNA.1.CDS.1 [Saccharomyces cerevisiae]CAI5198018.1 ANL_HP_G0138680.mRNA.1.CDS.1 [Saccharomyces cerevisiae]CAI6416280.1 ANL_HP_G0191490.mRNA.1.CDS.1 [Saccharomyces cerevisiae]
MSSIVNKSGTRFAPKVRQRRAATGGTPTPKPRTPQLFIPESKEIEEDNSDNDKGVDENETAIVEKPSLVGERSLEGFTLTGTNGHDNEIGHEGPIDASTQNPKADVIEDNVTLKPAPLQTHRDQKVPRSSRLASLSKDNESRPSFKPSFLDSSSNSNGTARRLSTISNKLPKKIRLGSITENDMNLKTFKRHRVLGKPSSAKKPAGAHRISIVSKISPPTAMTDSLDRNEFSSETSTSREADENENYVISKVKDIPKKVRDGESAKYFIDEENFTMAELCKPNFPIGQISENFEKSKMAKKAKLEKRRHLRELRMRARQEFKPLHSLTKEEQEEEEEKRKEERDKLLNADIPESDRKAHTAIQLKLNPDGTMAIDEETMVVDRHKNASIENEYKEKVDENPFANLYNYGSYGRGSYTDPWTVEEMIKFYKALSMWGTDFNLISQLYPYRSRKQVKAKFVNEEKKRPILIELALRSKLPPNFDEYCCEIKKNIGTVADFNEKLIELQNEHKHHMKEIEEAKNTAKEEDQTAQRLNDANLNKKGSGGIMTNDLKVYRKTEVVLGTIDDLKRKKLKERNNDDNEDNEGSEEEPEIDQ